MSDRCAKANHIWYWSEVTATQSFETGIQRVVRRLANALMQRGTFVVPVGWDSCRRLVKRLVRTGGVYGHSEVGAERARDCRPQWLIIPEIPSAALVGGVDPIKVGHAYGMKTAVIVHDLIPVKMAQDYDEESVQFYRRYFANASAADVVITTTQYVADDLRRYFDARDLRIPKIVTHPLPAQFAETERCTSRTKVLAPDDTLKFLTVSSWEPRKNLRRLLRAFAQAQSQSPRRIELTLVGKRGAFALLDEQIRTLADNTPNVVVGDYVSDEHLASLYESHHVSVYPSVEEGFGLPILESLWLATPCICHKASSMAEVAPGGGVTMIDMTDEAAIAYTLSQMATRPEALPRLGSEVLTRSLRTWADYAASIASTLGLPSKLRSLRAEPACVFRNRSRSTYAGPSRRVVIA